MLLKLSWNSQLVRLKAFSWTHNSRSAQTRTRTHSWPFTEGDNQSSSINTVTVGGNRLHKCAHECQQECVYTCDCLCLLITTCRPSAALEPAARMIQITLFQWSSSRQRITAEQRIAEEQKTHKSAWQAFNSEDQQRPGYYQALWMNTKVSQGHRNSTHYKIKEVRGTF